MTSRLRHRRRFSTAALAIAGVLWLGGIKAADEQADHAAAVATATAQAAQWLGELDARHYAESWEQTAAVVKQDFKQEQWTREVGLSREALGRSVMREQKRAEFSTQARGAPGQYVTVVYLTQFTNAPPLLENVLVKLDDDGRWRIAGYEIGNAQAEPPAAGAPAAGPTAPPKQ